jgi:ectoine hydroxylase-related dioxygenase (phytanoyl-CoA dioxygenase family)
MSIHHHQLSHDGFTTLQGVFSDHQVNELIQCIEEAYQLQVNQPEGAKHHAMRRFVEQVPSVRKMLEAPPFRQMVDQFASPKHRLVKSIYFDKPQDSNWFVARHQDLTLSVRERRETEGFHHWTFKEGQHAVQPPLPYLEDIFTFRIHLDDTDESNGALWVVPGSHAKGIVRPSMLEEELQREVSCKVPRGGVMVMRPLLMHRSQRSTGGSRRRVIHLECASLELPAGLEWSERELVSQGQKSVF